MSYSDFNKLDLNRKSHLIWVWGYYIANRKRGDFNKVLFALEDFFVEVSLHLGIEHPDHIIALAPQFVRPEGYGLKASESIFLKGISPKIPEYLQEVA
jgi:hypothetical protein